LEEKVNGWITEAELKWLPELKPYIRQEFSRIFLPSHDHLHHLRVWKISCRLLTSISVFNTSITRSTVEATLIASMFHDLGMVMDYSKDHGKVSRNMCENYFSERNLPLPALFEDILNAIEVHDRKGDYDFPEIPVTSDLPLDTLLTVADDLDALGTVGIYRYAEIYLKRGIAPEHLGIEILGNLTARYSNLAKTCRICPSVLRHFTPLYNEVISFYDKYNQQILADPNPVSTRSGHIGVINLIRQLSLEQHIPPAGFFEHVNKNDNGMVAYLFFSKLKNEYEAYSADFDNPPAS